MHTRPAGCVLYRACLAHEAHMHVVSCDGFIAKWYLFACNISCIQLWHPNWAFQQSTHGSPPAGAQIFVDPFFREQFAVGFGQLAQPYHHFVSTLPQVFVGTLQMLHSACSIVTHHLESVLGCVTALPPWRSVGALLSRWLPTQFVDTAWWPHSAQMMSVVVNTGKGTTEQLPSEEEAAHAAISSLLNRESTSQASSDENPTGSAGSSKRAGAGSVSPAHVQVVGFLLPKINAQAIELAEPDGKISYSIAGQQQALPPPHSIQQQQQQQLQGRQQEDLQLVCRSSISAPVPVPARTSGPGGHKHAHLSTHLHMPSPSSYKPADSTSAPHSMQTDGSMGGAGGNSSIGTMRSSGPSQSSPVSALTLRLRAEQKRQRERELEQQQMSSALTACTSASPPSPWSNASHCSAAFYATSGAALETADCS